MIYESGLVSATDTDVLAGGRLNSIPYAGKLIIDLLADLGSASANYKATIQRPGGKVPVDSQLVPASGSGLDGVLDERELMRISFNVDKGGHVVLSLTETGTAVCMWRAVLLP